ncbi:unnamed protein product [Diamesa hyperborea]
MKFISALIVVILFQTSVIAISYEENIIFNKYQIIQEPIEVGYVSSFGISVESFAIQTKQNYLKLNEFGMITINSNASTNETLIFKVLMKKRDKLDEYISSTVYLTVTILTDEIIENNALVILKGVTSVEFINSSKGQSQYDQLISFLNNKLNVKSCNSSTNINVQIFSIKSAKNPFILDVRFTVRSISENDKKMYFHQDKLHWILLENQEEIEKMLNIKVGSIGSDLCLMKESHCKSSCRLKIKENNQFQNVTTFQSTFKGPETELESICAPTENYSKRLDKQSFKVKLIQLPGECYNEMQEIQHFESMDMSFDLVSNSINDYIVEENDDYSVREYAVPSIPEDCLTEHEAVESYEEVFSTNDDDVYSEIWTENDTIGF